MKLKSDSYEIRMDASRVSIKHRVPLWKNVMLWTFVAYFCGAVIFSISKSISEGFADIAALLAAIFPAILFAFVTLVGSIRLVSGEVVQCDKQEFHVASRRLWGRWHHRRYRNEQILKLKWAVRNAGKYTYSVLTFQVGNQTIDILREITWTDADHILRACKSFGIDTLIDETDAAMRRDIDKRGWWVNPLKPDPPSLQ